MPYFLIAQADCFNDKTIQSEKVVMENGAALSKAITGILQNFEEHMLYTIQLNEEMGKLKKENSGMKILLNGIFVENKN